MDILYIVMPAYNEEENIENTVQSWYPILEGKDEASRLVIADSGSTDQTHEKLLELQKTYPQLEILTECEKQHGPKLMALYDYAIQKGADYVFQTDSDGQTNPAEFADFWESRDAYDAVIGYRPNRGDGAARVFVEKVVCILLKLYFGVSVLDANTPFRLMRTDMLSKYLPRLPKDYFLPNIMLTTYFAYYKENCSFKPISFKPRRAGKNSINIPRIIKIGYEALGDFRRFKKEM